MGVALGVARVSASSTCEGACVLWSRKDWWPRACEWMVRYCGWGQRRLWLWEGP